MFISENGLNLIKEFEGCILQSYDDYNDNVVCQGSYVRGTLTIGYGHTGMDIFKGMVISQQQADNLLKNDMVEYCNQVQELINDGTITFPLNQNMFDALVSFDYNCGQGSLRALCQGRDKQTVADMMLEYRNKGSVWERGLLRRRQAERNLFLSDCEGGEVISCTASDPIQKAKDFVGERCSELQKLLIAKGYDCGGYGADGKFGQGTYNSLIQFQKDYGLTIDGLAGEQTFSALKTSIEPKQFIQGNDWVSRLQQECNNQGFSNQNIDGISGTNTLNGCPTLREGANGNITRLLQEKLNALGYSTNGIDGDFGPGTNNAVIQFQRDRGLTTDGVVGNNTWHELLGL